MQWLFLVNQMRTPDSRERVRVWRLTKKVGALLYRNSVYVLPYSRERLEDFQWLCQQIRDSKGDASVFVSAPREERENRALRQLFLSESERGYARLVPQIQKHLDRSREAGRKQPLSAPQLRLLEKDLRRLEEMFLEISRTDFFHSTLSGKIGNLLKEARAAFNSIQLHDDRPQRVKHYSRSDFKGKVWATRAHIHIDRLCSAWLIRRFIDRKAKFIFAPEHDLPADAILFDLFGAEFSHQGDLCTFETLLKAFRLNDKALASIAELVHDIDLKDQKYHREEAAGIDAIIRAISISLSDDNKTLELGSQILDALYDRLSADGA